MRDTERGRFVVSSINKLATWHHLAKTARAEARKRIAADDQEVIIEHVTRGKYGFNYVRVELKESEAR